MKTAAIDFDTLQRIVSPKFPAGSTIGDVINRVLGYIFPIMGFLLLIYLIYGGYLYLTSMNNPKAIEKALNTIMWAVVGFLIMFAAYWIVRIIGMVLGIEAIANIFG